MSTLPNCGRWENMSEMTVHITCGLRRICWVNSIHCLRVPVLPTTLVCSEQMRDHDVAGKARWKCSHCHCIDNDTDMQLTCKNIFSIDINNFFVILTSS